MVIVANRYAVERPADAAYTAARAEKWAAIRAARAAARRAAGRLGGPDGRRARAERLAGAAAGAAAGGPAYGAAARRRAARAEWFAAQMLHIATDRAGRRRAATRAWDAYMRGPAGGREARYAAYRAADTRAGAHMGGYAYERRLAYPLRARYGRAAAHKVLQANMSARAAA